jgi:nucleoside-diphosphate-sugar epimerase
MATIFLTGGTGFIGKRLLKILSKFNKIFLLVRRESIKKVKQFGKELYSGIEIFEGDLEQERLGLSDELLKKIFQEVDYIYHLAASYDPSLPREKIFEINLEGTKRLSLLAKEIKNLKAFIYISTAYVSGEREGKILENYQVRPPSFRNFYEEAKFMSELFLKNINLPLIIIRPALVVGDSRTGEVDLDIKTGIYQLIKIIDKGFLFFYPGECNGTLSAVPVDWVAEAIYKIGRNEKSVGKIFHLSDPKPMRVKDFIDNVCTLLKERKPYFIIPKIFFNFLPRSWIKAQIMMLNRKQIFDMSNTTTLIGKDSLPPSLASYLPILINYYRNNLR